MANIIYKIKRVKIAEHKREEIQKKISNWHSLHRWIAEGMNEDDILKAMKIELMSKQRYGIIKRLHQKYTRTNAKDEFAQIEQEYELT